MWLWVTKTGVLQRVEYTFLPFQEIENDWQNYPLPPLVETVEEPPDDVQVVFST